MLLFVNLFIITTSTVSSFLSISQLTIWPIISKDSHEQFCFNRLAIFNLQVFLYIFLWKFSPSIMVCLKNIMVYKFVNYLFVGVPDLANKNIAQDIIILKLLFIVYLKLKFKWASYILSVNHIYLIIFWITYIDFPLRVPRGFYPWDFQTVNACAFGFLQLSLVCLPRRKPSPRTQLCWYPDFRISASRTVKT